MEKLKVSFEFELDWTDLKVFADQVTKDDLEAAYADLITKKLVEISRDYFQNVKECTVVFSLDETK
jgi:hypothetical protein